MSRLLFNLESQLCSLMSPFEHLAFKPLVQYTKMTFRLQVKRERWFPQQINSGYLFLNGVIVYVYMYVYIIHSVQWTLLLFILPLLSAFTSFYFIPLT